MAKYAFAPTLLEITCGPVFNDCHKTDANRVVPFLVYQIEYVAFFPILSLQNVYDLSYLHLSLLNDWLASQFLLRNQNTPIAHSAFFESLERGLNAPFIQGKLHDDGAHSMQHDKSKHLADCESRCDSGALDLDPIGN